MAEESHLSESMKSICPLFLHRKSIPCCPFPGCLSHSSGQDLRLPACFGSYFRSSDSRWIQRFRCKACLRTFSRATLHPNFRQKKRRLNSQLFKLFASGVSQRRAALLLHTSKNTVARKLAIIGNQALIEHQKFIVRRSRKLTEVQFDELETFEHTKMKPISIPLAVDANSRTILGFQACSMPAKGLLAEKSRRKYGRRADQRPKALSSLMKEITPWVSSTTLIRSDSNPYYSRITRRHFSKTPHLLELSRRGCVTGQGELKRGGHDPLFSLNHTCAMLRANINRLFRRTWCTTKRVRSLIHHLAIYVVFHNTRLTILKSTDCGVS
jgi:transposase-like protein